jgi:hypothetical protein
MSQRLAYLTRDNERHCTPDRDSGPAEQSTPIARRISSVRYSDHPPPVTVEKLDKLLMIEIGTNETLARGNLLTIEIGDTIHTNDNLVDRIFPRNRLPFSINATLLHSLTNVIYSKKQKAWANFPSTAKEVPVAEWMNSIGMYFPLLQSSILNG